MESVYEKARSGYFREAIGMMLDRRRKALRREFKYSANHSWYVVGDLYWKTKNYQSAIQAFRKSLRAQPFDFAAMWAVGNCYSELSKHKLAERYFRKALEIKPRHAAIRFNLANTLYDQCQFEEAAKLYRQVARGKSDVAHMARRNLRLIRERSDVLRIKMQL